MSFANSHIDKSLVVAIDHISAVCWIHRNKYNSSFFRIALTQFTFSNNQNYNQRQLKWYCQRVNYRANMCSSSSISGTTHHLRHFIFMIGSWESFSGYEHHEIVTCNFKSEFLFQVIDPWISTKASVLEDYRWRVQGWDNLVMSAQIDRVATNYYFNCLSGDWVAPSLRLNNHL